MHATGQIVHTGKWGMPHQQFKKGNGTLQQETCMCGSGNPKGVGFSSKVPLVAPTLTQPWHNAMVQMRGCGVWYRLSIPLLAYLRTAFPFAVCGIPPRPMGAFVAKAALQNFRRSTGNFIICIQSRNAVPGRFGLLRPCPRGSYLEDTFAPSLIPLTCNTHLNMHHNCFQKTRARGYSKV
jgi:hypothetical protein